jgi:hypothetical protein
MRYLLLAILFVNSLTLLGQTATPPPGSGTFADPYRLSTVDHLYWLSQTTSVYYQKYFELENDIDATVTATWDAGLGFTPIGNATDIFNQADFNGNGYVIYNLYINRPDLDYVGLFGYTSTLADIYDLGLINVDITGNNYVGGLTGNAYSQDTENCFVTGKVTGNDYVGGLLGNNARNITNSFAMVNVNGHRYVGGLVGKNYSFSAGYSIAGSFSSGTVFATANNTGGFIGDYNLSGSMTNNYALVDVVGDESVGGFIGYMRSTVTMENIFSTGTVQGNDDVGGSIGYLNNSITINNSYWDTLSSEASVAIGYNPQSGITGLATTDMFSQASFSGWSFGSIWQIAEGENYPYLDFQDNLTAREPLAIVRQPKNTDGNSAVFRANVNPMGSAGSARIAYGSTPGFYTDTLATVYFGSSFQDTLIEYSIAGLNPGALYYIKVIASNATGTSSSVEYEFANPQRISEPANFGAIDAGTATNPYQLGNLANLNWLTLNADYWDAHFVLTADIDASQTVNWNDGAGFQPIGIQSNPFSGVFNGNNYEIAGLTIDRSVNYIGFFGYTDGATILNLGFTGAEVNGYQYVGILLGQGINTDIDSCYVEGNVDYPRGWCGLLAGRLEGGSVEHSYARGDLNLYFRYGGGLVGSITSGTTVTQCYTRGNISGPDYVGGLIGESVGGIIRQCYSWANVAGTTSYSGGLIGNMSSSSLLSKSYSTGAVSGDRPGGLIGRVFLSVVDSSHWDTENSGQANGFYFASSSTTDMTGHTTADSKKQNSYEGFDFNNIWSIDENLSYPYFKWQVSATVAKPVAVLEPATDMTNASATLNGLITPNGAATTYYFLYGTTTGVYTDTTASAVLPAIFAPINVNAPIAGLSPHTQYYVKLYTANNKGTARSDELSFFTNASGSGTSGDPYIIASLSGLAWMSVTPAVWDSYFKLTADIDATPTQTWNGGQGFVPIGNFGNLFSGDFNGENHRIDGLFINRPDDDGVGLFGYVYQTQIDSLVLTNVNITGKSSIGGIVGNATSGLNNFSDFENCHVTGVINGYVNIGGILGYGKKIDLINCSVNANITAENDYVGGLLGSTVTSSSNLDMQDCYFNGQVSGNRYIGGLCGNLYASSSGFYTIQRSYALGSIYGDNSVGGIAGRIYLGSNSSITIRNCYTTAAVATSSRYGGGFTGYLYGAVTITKSYSAGFVSGAASNIGGFAGYQSNNPDVSYCFWDSVASGQLTSVVATAKSTEQMHDVNTFTTELGANSWDFTFETGDWAITDGYPFLQWQKPATISAPEVATLAATLITTSSAQLNASVNPLGDSTTYQFEYGTVSGILDLEAPLVPGQLGAVVFAQQVNFGLSGLTDNQVYYYRIKATNTGGTSYGEELSFSTFEVIVPPNGSGTENDPYLIGTLSELVWIADNTSAWDKTFRLIRDIDATASADLNNGNGFAPIGNTTTPFSGFFNGRSYIISNLTINRPAENYVGLFGKTDGARITDLGLTNVDITGQNYVGALVGQTGIGDSLLTNYSDGTVAGNLNVGGLVGWHNDASIGNCYCDVRTLGTGQTGGLVGYNFGGSINRAYSSGVVSATNDVGGLVGKVALGGVTIKSFWDQTTSGQSASAGGTGKITSQMYQKNTFTDWDFTTNWRIHNNFNYPFLAWENINEVRYASVAGSGGQNVIIGAGSAIDSAAFADVTSPGEFSIELWLEEPLNPAGINGNISKYRWVIDNNTLIIDETDGYRLRFKLADLYLYGGVNEFSGPDPNISDIVLYHRPNPYSGSFVAVSGDFLYFNNGTIGNRSDDYMISPLITTGFGEFAFGTLGDHQLPVELGAFTAAATEDGIALSWQTLSETSNMGFEIYRSATEFGTYEQVASYRRDDNLLGLGTSATGRAYNWLDPQAGLVAQTDYFYKICDVSLSGEVSWHGPLQVQTLAIPEKFALRQNYPNPFNPSTTIALELPQFVKDSRLIIYDIAGRKVRTLYEGAIQQHRFKIVWNGDNDHGARVATGVYFYHFSSPHYQAVRKMILIK